MTKAYEFGSSRSKTVMYKQRVDKQKIEDKKGWNNYQKLAKTNYNYMDYIANRPGVIKSLETGHGLFGNVCNINEDSMEIDYKSLCSKVYQNTKNRRIIMYDSIVSLKEEDAKGLGYLDRSKWMELAQEKGSMIAEKNNIPISTFKWVASVHMEKGHPHMHLSFWNDAQPRPYSYYKPPRIPNEIRLELIRDIFRDEFKQLNQDKTKYRDEIKKQGKGFFDEFTSLFDDTREELFNQSYKNELAHDINNIKDTLGICCYVSSIPRISLKEDQIKELMEGLLSLRKQVPKQGSLKYAYMSPDIKTMVNSLVDKVLLFNPEIKSIAKNYISTQLDVAKHYQGEDHIKTSDVSIKAMDEVYKMLGNDILKSVKSLINLDNFIDKKFDFETSRADYVAAFFDKLNHEIAVNTYFSIFSSIGRLSQRKTSKKNLLMRGEITSKKARKELAIKKSQSSGIDWER